MTKLSLFWGTAEDLSFTWRLSSPVENTIANDPLENYQIESQEILKADLSCLADMAAASQVSLVLSAKDIVVSTITVPKKAQRLLRKAIPYMIEEEVATPVDDLFFALSDKSKGLMLDVRAIEKSYLESIIKDFKQAEILLAEVVVDIDCIATPQEGMIAVVDDQQMIVVDADNNRWSCHQDDFAWLLQKQIVTEEEDELPIAIPLDIYSEKPLDKLLHDLPVGRFASQSHVIDSIEDFLISPTSPTINLLQAEYEAKKESSALSYFLRQVASIAALIFVSHLIYQGVNLYTLSEKKSQLDHQKFTLYKQAFPRSKKVRNPEKSMRVHMKSMGGSSGSAGFLSLLSSSSALLTDLDKIYPTNINYDNARNELRMDVIASDLVILDKFADALKANGHEVEKSSETQRGEGYSSRLTIRK